MKGSIEIHSHNYSKVHYFFSLGHNVLHTFMVFVQTIVVCS